MVFKASFLLNVGNGFEMQISKMGLHSPFGDLKFKLWSKEWSKIKLAT